MKVELIDHMGSDLSVVNAARVSFDKGSFWYNGELLDSDKRLIKFLARGMTTDDFDKFILDAATLGGVYATVQSEGWREKLVELLWQWRRTPEHFTPFAHPHVTFRIKAPIFVARQLGKHQVGFVWSEVSRRYIDSEPEFYTPETWRKRAENVKQGSSEEGVDADVGLSVANHVYVAEIHATAAYNAMLSKGVCPEQARMVLPASLLTEWIWTGSLYGWANLYKQRKTGSHAQRECWPIAEAIGEHMKELFPVSWEALCSTTPS